ncbi:hypothetical protein ACFL4W_05550 [Planctomycetota bacterium]
MDNPLSRLKQITDGGPVVFVWRQIKGLFRSTENHMKIMCDKLATTHGLSVDLSVDTSLEMAEALIEAYDHRNHDKRMEELIDLGNRYTKVERCWGGWFFVWFAVFPLGITLFGLITDTPDSVFELIIRFVFGIPLGMLLFGFLQVFPLILLLIFLQHKYPGYDGFRLTD